MSEAFFERGAAYDTTGGFPGAIAGYNEALRINPNMKKAAENREIALARLANTAQAGKSCFNPATIEKRVRH
jgi:Flp pilus assembly protein TadD